MPLSSSNDQVHSSDRAVRQSPKSPNRVVAEAELQWIYNEAELANTPSVQDGMSVTDEREVRAKGVSFIISVGILLKLPQLTLSTAAVLFQRFLMRASLKKSRDGIPKLHHYQSAATALFLATKIEESCRKMKELVQACCKVAQKNPNIIIDEQSKDFWKWRDCILDNEDVLLETLCFDLTVESPHRQLFEMLKWYKVEHNKPVRNSAWAWVTDTNNTQLCLLCSSRAIAAAGLYAACTMHKLSLPDDRQDRPWWETQHVAKSELLKAINYMVDHHEEAVGQAHLNGSGGESATGGSGARSIHTVLASPGMDIQRSLDETRLRSAVADNARLSPRPEGTHTVDGQASTHSYISAKRGHVEMENPNGPPLAQSRGSDSKRLKDDLPKTVVDPVEADRPDRSASHDIKHEEESAQVQNGNEQSSATVKAVAAKKDKIEGSEDGELDE